MVLILTLMLSALAVDAYPISYTNCGVDNVINAPGPQRVVTMNQGATEFMLSLGLADKMVGTAYLDDYIWPKYSAEYAKIPVLATGYPNETTIMSVDPDFIVGSYNSAFHARYNDTKRNRMRGIFSNDTVGPCIGTGSEWADLTSSRPTTSCRPQLNAKGIGTYLSVDACESKALRPQGGVTEETVYAEMRNLGSIFNVDAEAMISEMKEDFDAANKMVAKAMDGKKLRAVWLDGLDCGSESYPQHFLGAGSGAPQMLMEESGMENVFGHIKENWECVNESAIIAAEFDVMIIVDASWDSALDKITWLYNHSEFCGTDVLKGARLVQIPFSASTLSPRNGPAALDLAKAALHVRTGSLTPVQKSGVSSFSPQMLESHTAGLKCTMKKDMVLYGDEEPVTKAPATTKKAATTKAPATTKEGAAETTTSTPKPSLKDEVSGHPQMNGSLWLWILPLFNFLPVAFLMP